MCFDWKMENGKPFKCSTDDLPFTCCKIYQIPPFTRLRAAAEITNFDKDQTQQLATRSRNYLRILTTMKWFKVEGGFTMVVNRRESVNVEISARGS